MKYLNLIVLLFIIACSGPYEDTKTENTYEIETLFTHDGCTVYRFFDRLSPIYFTNCHGEASWRKSIGKSKQSVSVRGK
jgi:hypothetical protein